MRIPNLVLKYEKMYTLDIYESDYRSTNSIHYNVHETLVFNSSNVPPHIEDTMLFLANFKKTGDKAYDIMSKFELKKSNKWEELFIQYLIYK